MSISVYHQSSEYTSFQMNDYLVKKCVLKFSKHEMQMISVSVNVKTKQLGGTWQNKLRKQNCKDSKKSPLQNTALKYDTNRMCKA